MKSPKNSIEQVRAAFRLLKQDVYYDKSDLFLRGRIADFEADPKFTKRLKALSEVVDDFYTDETSKLTERRLNGWLKKIQFRLLPKSVGTQRHVGTLSEEKSPNMISNVRTSSQYWVGEGSVQYLFHGPIELYLLSTIWCGTVGQRLDNGLSSSCFGNRLEGNGDWERRESTKLFKLYNRQYSKWRDTAMERAKELLERGESSIILSLDIKQCFYHISIDWERLAINADSTSSFDRNLNDVLKSVHQKYRGLISKFLVETHPSVSISVRHPPRIN